MAHCIVEEAEKILDREFPVLDHGFIRLVDYLGSDSRIVQSARVSYGEGTKTIREDAGLIDYLLRHQHTSPFEQVVLTFHIKLPIFVARQWIRHRTARVNEISGRYSIMKDEFYIPKVEDVAFQSLDNKQGRSTTEMEKDLSAHVIQELQEGQKSAFTSYSGLIEKGIARELSRINLPLSMYTEWYWQIDLHNLFHFLKLRMDAHAQKEIRDYADVMFEIVKKVCPLACDSFQRNIQKSILFTDQEVLEIKAKLSGKPGVLKGKELERFEEKLNTGKIL